MCTINETLNKMYQSRTKAFAINSFKGKVAKKHDYIIIIILISAFGPYLTNNIAIRLDNAVIYGFFLWSLGIMLFRLRKGFTHTLETVFALLGLFSTVSLYTLCVSYFRSNNYEPIRVLAAVENYLEPIALITVIAMRLYQKNSYSKQKLLENACLVVCVLLCINTIIAILQMYTDTWPLVRYFVRANSREGFSVWRNSVSNGRYLGLFNQPVEAGLAYSLGLGAWLYLLESKQKVSIFNLLLLIGLACGGVINVSKVFILGGAPVAILFFLGNGTRIFFKPKHFIQLLLITFALSPLIKILDSVWKGSGFFFRLFQFGSADGVNLLRLYTAGRFGEQDTILKSIFAHVWAESPIFGFGFGAFDKPLDNAFIEFFYQGGLIGLTFYCSMLLVIIIHILRYFDKSKREAHLLTFIIIIVVFAGIGTPVLTINRSSILLWTLLVLSIGVSADVRKAAYIIYLRGHQDSIKMKMGAFPKSRSERPRNLKT